MAFYYYRLGAIGRYCCCYCNQHATKTFVKDNKKGGDDSKNGSPKLITIEKDPEVDKMIAVRNKITRYVTAQTSGFDKATFGGISNLKIKVRNTSSYPIDDVELQINYIQSNGKIYKSETVYGTTIEPNASITVDGPDASRGTDVSVKILSINSHQLALCYVAGRPGPDPEDPYRCE
ncbi:MAG: hypothetical protein M0D57_18720 [Sphingobacteriales bacterium JAD_PAG50586_3]|nr:MAG: hypothetical protein M0D57_18720 [Sphingobacteriales bacterium JAD_PAG50586_3]